MFHGLPHSFTLVQTTSLSAMHRASEFIWSCGSLHLTRTAAWTRLRSSPPECHLLLCRLGLMYVAYSSIRGLSLPVSCGSNTWGLFFPISSRLKLTSSSSLLRPLQFNFHEPMSNILSARDPVIHAGLSLLLLRVCALAWLSGACLLFI